MAEQNQRVPRPDFDKIITSIKGLFPIVSKGKSVDIDDIKPKISVSPDDTISQVESKLKGRTFGNKIEATLSIKDSDGKLIDKDRISLLTVPELTNMLSFIVDGNDYQVPLQLRLKPNLYFEKMKTGEFRARFNTNKGKSFSVQMNPATRQIFVDAGTRIGIYPLLKLLDVDDEKIKGELGQDFFKSISSVNTDRELAKATRAFLFKSKYGQDSPEKLKQQFKNNIDIGEYARARLNVKTTDMSGDALLGAARELLDVYKGKREIDDIRDLKHNGIYGVDDFLAERISLKTLANKYKNKVKQRLAFNDKVKDVVSPLSSQVLGFFRNDDTGIVQYAKQINPVSILSDASRVILTGSGAISDPNKITLDIRNVHPSSYGFIDPVATPDNAKAGVSLYLSAATQKDGNKLISRMYNARTKKNENVSPEDLAGKTVTTFDEVGGKKKKLISFKDGNVVRVGIKDIDYIISPIQAFGISTLLTPFLASNQGNRAMMSAKMMSQALPLKDPDEPLVKSGIPGITGDLEDIIGRGISHASPVSGTILSIKNKKDVGYVITIKDDKGKKHTVQFASEYPFNENTYMSEDAIVSKGDKVKEGQLLTKTSFSSKGGTLTLGKNLKVAYMPYLSSTYDDSVVISEAAAKKLTSLHMYKYEIPKESVYGKKKFITAMPGSFKPADIKHLDEKGLPLVGSNIESGQPIFLALDKFAPTPIHQQLSTIDKRFLKPYSDRSVVWENHVSGKVVNVVDRGKEYVVYVKSEEPAQVGDKLVQRTAAKGIISEIMPDDSMPRDKAGDPIDIILNPIGIPSRINLGQVHETLTAKVANKNGKPISVSQFGQDNYEYVKKLLKDNNVSDKEDIFDPKTGRTTSAMLGYQYFLKLNHPVLKKFSVRQREGYSVDQRPLKVSGTKHNAKSLDAMSLYALMSHGVDNFLEDSLRRSSSDPGFWAAYESGLSIPPPQPSFVNRQFLNYLRVAGVNTEESGDRIKFSPMLDKDTDNISSGEIVNPLSVKTKNLLPEKGGLFDETVTGGLQGQHWASIKLKEPVPHPLYAEFIKNIIGVLGHDYNTMSGAEIKKVLSDTNAASLAKKISASLSKAKAPRSGLVKAVKALRGISRHKMSLGDLVITKVPVLPPVFRPLYPLADGTLEESPINKAYKNLLMVNEINTGTMTKDQKAEYYQNLQDAVSIVIGMHDISDGDFREGKGAVSLIKGVRNKYGMFQNKLIKRRLDYTAQSVSVPDYTLGINEMGIPENMAWGLFAPHTTRRLSQLGFKPTEAREMVEQRSPDAKRALDLVMKGTPIVANRAPSLHKFSMMAFLPKIVSGDALKTNPLINEGFNLDHDGDSISGPMVVRDLGGKVFAQHISKMNGGKHLFTNGNVDQYSVKSLYVLNGDGRLVLPSSFSEHRNVNFAETYTFRGMYIGLATDNSLFAVNKNMDTERCNPYSGQPVLVHAAWKQQPCLSEISREAAADEAISLNNNSSLWKVSDYCIFGPMHIRVAFVTSMLSSIESNDLSVSALVLPVVDLALRSVGITAKFIERGDARHYIYFNRKDMSALFNLAISENLRNIIASRIIDWEVGLPECISEIIAEDTGVSFIGRISAKTTELCDAVEMCRSNDPLYLKWLNIYENNWKYDFITKINDFYVKSVAYDITLDDKVFVANGVTVWDTMMLHVPITEKGISDAKTMIPSLNLVNPRTNDIINTIRNEGIITLNLLTRQNGKNTSHKFNDIHEAEKVYNEKKIDYNDIIRIGGNKTSFGVALIRDALPNAYKSIKLPETRKEWNVVFRRLANGPASEYESTINKLSHIAFGRTVDVGFSIGLKDIEPVAELEKLSRKYEVSPPKDLDAVRKHFDSVVKNSTSNIAFMSRVGAMGSTTNIRQALAAPVQVQDINDKPIPLFIGGNYSRGLKMSSYLATAPAVRKGIVDRSLMTAEPGALSKELAALMFSSSITMDDCKTRNGIQVDEVKDLVDRFLAHPKDGYKYNTIITPDIAVALANSGGAVVRSPVTCEAGSGVCKKCYGYHYGGKLPDIGDNVGVMSGQSMSEPTTQMTMRCVSGIVYDKEYNATAMEDAFDNTTSVNDITKHGSSNVNVMAWSKHKPDGPIVLIKTNSGNSMVCQANHPLWVIDLRNAVPCGHYRHLVLDDDGYHCNRCRKKYGRDILDNVYEFELEQADQLRDYHAIKLCFNDVSGTAADPGIDGYIAGLYAGDGSCRIGNRREMQDLVRGKAYNKRLKPGFNRYSKEWLMLFVAGLIDSDGTVYNRNGCTVAKISTTSYYLAQQIEILGHVLKINVNIHRYMPSKKGMIKHKNQPFNVELRFPDIDKWKPLSVKLSSIECLCAKKNLFWPGSGFVRVVSVKELPLWAQDVYDPATETAGYICGMLRTHNSFHSGGAGGAGISSGFTRLKQLITLPNKLADQAVLSQSGGRVTKITKDVSGGHNVFVGKDKTFIPPTLSLGVKKGQKVNPGDRLSSGDINPYTVLETTGWENAIQFLRKEILDQYQKAGIEMRSRPVETVLHGIGNIYEVTDPGNTEFTRGEFINKSQIATGMKVRRTIKGSRAANLAMKTDPFERLAFQRLENAIREAGIEFRESEPYKSPLSTYVTEKNVSERRKLLAKNRSGK